MEMKKALEALAALAQETRLDVFRLLMRAGPKGAAASEIAARLGVRPNTLSTHLGILARADLIGAERQGRSIRYCVSHSTMRDLLAFLMQDCCGGDPKICSSLFEATICDS